MRCVGQTLGVGRLLAERPDLARVGLVEFDDTKLVGEVDRLTDRGDRDAGTGLDVLLHHLGEVHAVDVVGTDDDDDLRPLVVDEVERLEDRVGAAEVPVLVDSLLGRHRRDVVAEHRRHPPRLGHVLVEAVRLVLRQHDDLEIARVDDVGEGEIDEPVDAAERHRGFRTVSSQRHEPLPLAAGEDDGQDLGVAPSTCHVTTLERKHPTLSRTFGLVSECAHRHHFQGIPAGHLRGGWCSCCRTRESPPRAWRRRSPGPLLRCPARRSRHHGIPGSAAVGSRECRAADPWRRRAARRRLRRG